MAFDITWTAGLDDRAFGRGLKRMERDADRASKSISRKIETGTEGFRKFSGSITGAVGAVTGLIGVVGAVGGVIALAVGPMRRFAEAQREANKEVFEGVRGLRELAEANARLLARTQGRQTRVDAAGGTAGEIREQLRAISEQRAALRTAEAESLHRAARLQQRSMTAVPAYATSGALTGGAIGSFLGPAGTFLGAVGGAGVGGALGFAEHFLFRGVSTADSPYEEAQQAAVAAREQLRLLDRQRTQLRDQLDRELRRDEFLGSARDARRVMGERRAARSLNTADRVRTLTASGRVDEARSLQVEQRRLSQLTEARKLIKDSSELYSERVASINAAADAELAGIRRAGAARAEAERARVAALRRAERVEQFERGDRTASLRERVLRAEGRDADADRLAAVRDRDRLRQEVARDPGISFRDARTRFRLIDRLHALRMAAIGEDAEAPDLRRLSLGVGLGGRADLRRQVFGDPLTVGGAQARRDPATKAAEGTKDNTDALVDQLGEALGVLRQIASGTIGRFA